MRLGAGNIAARQRLLACTGSGVFARGVCNGGRPLRDLVSALRPNRPLRRYLARLASWLRYGPAGAHAEEWWPNLALKLASADTGSIRYRGRVVAPLLPYPQPGGFDEIVIVGSGPSLADQDRSKIPIEKALLLNGAIHLLAAGGRRPLGLVIEDERFVWRHAATIAALVPSGTDCYFSTSVLLALCETIPDWLAGQKVRHLDFLHRPYAKPKPDAEGLERLDFLRWSADRSAAISLLPQSGLMPGGSVAVTAAQIALFLAPARIGLAGIDLTRTTQPRFYETAGDRAMSRIEAAAERVLAALSVIKDECTKRKITIENYSPMSRLADIGLAYAGRLERRETDAAV